MTRLACPRRLALVAALCAILAPQGARAQDLTPPDIKPVDPSVEAEPSGIRWNKLALFAAGAATGFVAHESCHVAANLAFGNTPHLESVTFLGFVPFFAISPNVECRNGHCTTPSGQPFGKQALYTIVSAGIQCQQYEDEVILTLEPRLRFEDAPFRKGMVTFNTLLSVGYVLSDWAGIEPPAGDMVGIHRDAGAPRHLMNTLVLGVAGLDIARYFFPDASWLAWVSRSLKVTVTGVVFTL